jgi:polyisoprenoid-binding protein YceI
MNYRNATRIVALAGISSALTFAADSTKTTDAMQIAVEGGTATFVSPTNVSAISVKGKSTALHAEVAMRRTPDGLQLERIEASMPVMSLVTGMNLRDEHMRKYIFTTPEGKTPDLRFEGENTACPAGKETVCQVSGNLSIRGVAHAFTLPVRIKDDGTQFKATGDGTVKLSDYGIEQPSQLGVKSTNEVHLHLEFVAKPAPARVAGGGAR